LFYRELESLIPTYYIVEQQSRVDISGKLESFYDIEGILQEFL